MPRRVSDCSAPPPPRGLRAARLPDALRWSSQKHVDEVGTLIQGNLRGWRPDKSGRGSTDFAGMCSVRKQQDPDAGVLSVSYGSSYAGFDFYRKNDDRGIVSLNDDVLLSRPYSWDPTAYWVIIRCQVAGAPVEQADGAPVIGMLTDGLTGDTDPRPHFAHLLHSARVMVEALGCTNKPVVPGQPPASVR